MASGPQPVVVVSGIPRSGTSLMMRMLGAAGLPLLCDAARPPDEDNPRGYFEYAPVKATRRDAAWVDAAAGHAVKVIHALVPDLPADRRYRVIFMHRDLDQVLVSQQRMLERAGRRGGELADAELKRAFARQLERAVRHAEDCPAFQVLHVDYQALLDAAGDARARALARVAAFVERPGSEPAMAAVIEPALHRNR